MDTPIYKAVPVQKYHKSNGIAYTHFSYLTYGIPYDKCSLIYIYLLIGKRRKFIMSGYGYGGGFALIVVLFILLIIVGASWLY